MGSVSRLALAAAFALGTASLAAAPAAAQSGTPSFTKEERAALMAAEAALNARNYPAAQTALTAAQAAARGSDARNYVARLQLRLGRETANLPLQASAIDALIASGTVPQSELGAFYTTRGAIALHASRTRDERERAEAILTRGFQMSPTADTALTLAQLKLERRKDAEAIPLIERSIELAKSSGRAVPESWYRRALTLSTMQKLAPQVLKLNREWIAAYPSEENWRDAILLYRDNANPDSAAALDAYRLQRLAKGLAGERDYLEAAQAFTAAGLPGEAKSVLDEGVARRMVDPGKATFKEAIAAATRAAATAKGRLGALKTAATAAATGAPALEAGDQHLSFGDYAGAAELFRAAVAKGGVDPAIANTRLGVALALANQRAEAEAAFRAVTGPRAELAALWLVWLGQRT